MPTQEEALEELLGCGFSDEQAECLLRIFALHPHTHDIEDVVGLDEELDEISQAL